MRTSFMSIRLGCLHCPGVTNLGRAIPSNRPTQHPNQSLADVSFAELQQESEGVPAAGITKVVADFEKGRSFLEAAVYTKLASWRQLPWVCIRKHAEEDRQQSMELEQCF